jgi:ABC-type molybdenum transport system ATPase subunit/photorepair protein PhrA
MPPEAAPPTPGPAAAPRTPAIALDGLVRRRGERVVLRDVSLIVPAGATVALLGAAAVVRRARKARRRI